MEISKIEYLSAIKTINKYVEQEKIVFGNLFNESLPFTGLNIYQFINKLDLSSRATNVFNYACKQFFEDQCENYYSADLPPIKIREMSEYDILKNRNCGKKTLIEIKLALEKHGIFLN